MPLVQSHLWVPSFPERIVLSYFILLCFLSKLIWDIDNLRLCWTCWIKHSLTSHKDLYSSVNNHLHSHNYTGYWSFIFHQHEIWVFSTSDAFSLFSHKFVWMMSWCCSLIYSAILLMLNECKVHLTSKYVTLVTARQCQPKFFLLEHLYKLK